jgi:ribosomal protein S18 acetylase RimI-like enzyme
VGPEVAVAIVRRARPADAAAIARMANALNRHEALSPRAFSAAVVRRDAFGPRRAFGVVVAEARGRPVGYAAFGVGYNTDIAARELWMHDLFVLPAWRGRGVGRALVGAVAREAARRGLASLGWGVRGTNRRALRFYRGLGARIGHVRLAGLRGRALAALAPRR